MASGYPGHDLHSSSFAFGNGSAVQIPFQSRSEGGGGGLLKRSLTEMERQHQQQMQLQQALYLRSVKQKTHLASPISPLSPFDLPTLSPSPPSSCFSADFGAISSSSASSMVFSGSPSSSGLGFGRRQPNPCPSQAGFSFSAATATAAGGGGSDPAMRNRLQELERRLLDDDDEGEDSAVTNTEWSDAMQQLISPAAPPATTAQSLLSPSPTTSCSSTSSSSASCSPSTSTPSSRQMLLDTAAAIADGNSEAAAATLAVLKRAANPRGDPEQRLTAMMVASLIARMNPPPPGTRHPYAELCSLEHVAATQMLHEFSPCFKLALFAANLAILDATRDHLKIHILDFDVGGGQYAALIHALAERHLGGPPPAVRITAVADPAYPFNGATAAGGSLRVVGDRLSKLAERAGVFLQFDVLTRRAAEVDREVLNCEPGEALAVNLAFVASRIADESVTPANPRDELLRRVKSLQPAVVTLVEQEMNGNTAPFATRFAAACEHYGAVAESLEAAAVRDSRERAQIEAGLVRRAANSVAREGPDRVERPEVFGKWRARMGMAGFRAVPLGPALADPVRSRAGSVRGGQGVTVKEEAGGLGLGWLGRVVTVASAWR